MGDLPGLLIRFQQLAIFFHAGEAEACQPVVESSADHLLFFVAQMDAALVINQLADKLKVRVADVHGGAVGISPLSVLPVEILRFAKFELSIFFERPPRNY